MPVLDLVGGWHAGPLFVPKIRRAPIRPKGKEGMVHRAQTRRRTPPWVDKEAINVFYVEARRLTLETGELHVVDHIVPKCGGIVSGLHVPWNLRVIHWYENNQKGARVWPDMPMEQQEFNF